MEPKYFWIICLQEDKRKIKLSRAQLLPYKKLTHEQNMYPSLIFWLFYFCCCSGQALNMCPVINCFTKRIGSDVITFLHTCTYALPQTTLIIGLFIQSNVDGLGVFTHSLLHAHLKREETETVMGKLQNGCKTNRKRRWGPIQDCLGTCTLLLCSLDVCPGKNIMFP